MMNYLSILEHLPVILTVTVFIGLLIGVPYEIERTIMAAEKESGKIVSVGFQPRYGRNFQRVNEITASAARGDVY